jgi:hypothetical protein
MTITPLGKYAVLVEETKPYTASQDPQDITFTINHNLGSEKLMWNFTQCYLTGGIVGGIEATATNPNQLVLKFKNCITGGNGNAVLQMVLYIPHSIQIKVP